jgi:hypothetical protein
MIRFKSSKTRVADSKHTFFSGFCDIFLSFLSSFAKLRNATTSYDTSASLCVGPPAWNISAPTGRIFVKFDT